MNESASNKKIKASSKGAAKKTVTAVKAAPVVVKAPEPVRVTPAAAPKKATVTAPKAAAPKATAPAASVTTIVAKVDIGFGNTLFLRGTGPGLSWEKGVEMTNAGSDEWTWSTNKASKTFLAKILINDVTWSGDADSTIVAGAKTVIKPTF